MKKVKNLILDILDVKILEAKLLLNKDAIVIYQMGKVGSTTVYFSLKKQLLFTPVFHVHCLSQTELKKQKEAYKAVGKNPYLVRHLRQGNLINKKLNKSAGIKWKIITLVRDPIGREISIFFQQRDRNFPNGIKTTKVIEILQKKLAAFEESTDFVCNWFDREIKNNFNINILDFAFNQNQGYHIIESQDKTVLVIRLEDLNNCFRPALAEFLDINKPIELKPENIATKKQYKNQYLEVIEKIKIPQDVCESIYASKYARHFYSDEMLNNFIQKWTKK